MKTIERYVFGAFLSSFVLAFLVLSFVLTIGLLVQIVSFVMDGVPMSLVGEFCLVSLPETLQWSMPLALLVSAILVFSRLSADSEIAAMRACGVNLMSVMKWPALFGLFCTLLGFWVNNEIVPRGHEVRRTLKAKVSVKAGLSVLEPGRIIDDFPGLKLYFGRKEGNWLFDVVGAYREGDDKEMIYFRAGKMLVTQAGSDITLDGYSVDVDHGSGRHEHFGRLPYTLHDVISDSKYKRRQKDFRFLEMCRYIREQERQIGAFVARGEAGDAWLDSERKDLSCLKVELNKRFVFAMASLCFVLIGIPLGVRSQRKESTVGMAISLAVSLGYYVLVILMLSCEGMYAVHPEFFIWLPVVLCFALAAAFTRKHL